MTTVLQKHEAIKIRKIASKKEELCPQSNKDTTQNHRRIRKTRPERVKKNKVIETQNLKQ